MPGVDVFVKLSEGLLLDFQSAQLLALDLCTAFHYVVYACLMGRESCSDALLTYDRLSSAQGIHTCPVGPTSTHSIDNEVVREFWDCHGEVDIGLWVEFVAHLDAVHASDLPSWRKTVDAH